LTTFKELEIFKTDKKHYYHALQETTTKLKMLPLHELDTNSEYLNKAFTIAYDAALFTLHEYDPTIQNELKLALFSALCPLSGSLAFLAVQILAANRIMQSNNFANAETYYQKRCGIIINHLRAPKTVIDSSKSEKGYTLNGHLTWASGYGIFDTLVVGFHHEGEEMQAVMPFSSKEAYQVTLPAQTMVGESMSTVTMDLENYEIPFENIINTQEIGYYTKQKSISKTVHFALYGIGLGAIDAINDPEVKTSASEALESIKELFLSSNDGAQMDTLRIELFTLAQHIITTGMILSGGKSILKSETLQRYYRELIMFNANGLNNTIKALFKNSFL
jgi:hypothetical protein